MKENTKITNETTVKILDLFEYADRLEELGEEELAEKLRNDIDNINFSLENLLKKIYKLKGE